MKKGRGCLCASMGVISWNAGIDCEDIRLFSRGI